MQKIKNLSKIVSVISASVLFPALAFAQGPYMADIPQTDACGAAEGLAKIICKLNSLANLVLPFLITLGVVYFIYGVVTYVIASDEEAKTTGKDRMIYGIIGFAVIVGVWGLVNIVSRTFGLDSNNTAPKDQIRGLLPTNN